MLEVGKLYQCKDYFLLLYPDKETATAADAAEAATTAAAAAAYWSNRLVKPISCVDKNIPILVLKAEVKFYEVLVEDKKGWIIYQDWLELKEISNENIS